MDYKQATVLLQQAYNRESANNRNQVKKEDWKITERQIFLDQLQREGKQDLLEIGAGTGTDSLFFQQQGLRVISTDLSPAMVELCREKGLEAYVMDFLGLNFAPSTFDAIYALNCLLHVPTKDLPLVLLKIRDLLRPGGLFFLGVYGGSQEKEGIREDDWHNPPRFFAHHTDDFMRQAVSPFFEIVSFRSIPLQTPGWNFQSFILRRANAAL